MIYTNVHVSVLRMLCVSGLLSPLSESLLSTVSTALSLVWELTVVNFTLLILGEDTCLMHCGR